VCLFYCKQLHNYILITSIEGKPLASITVTVIKPMDAAISVLHHHHDKLFHFFQLKVAEQSKGKERRREPKPERETHTEID